MPEHKISLTTGAAHWAYGLLNSNKGCKMEDLFTSGHLARKLREAKGLPLNDGETQAQYDRRLDAWMDSPHCVDPLEVTQSEYEFMRALLKARSEKSELPGNYHVADLCIAFGLDKP